MQRHKTREVPCGRLVIGGGQPIWVQSMTAGKTSDLGAMRREIAGLLDAGCEIVRVAVFDRADAEAVGAVRKMLGSVPLVADVHFNHRHALTAIEQGADKVRLNPGNIAGVPGSFAEEGRERVRAVAGKAKAKGVSMRVGVNSGSVEKDLLEKHGWPSPEAMVESALRHCAFLDSIGFRDVVVSIKATRLEHMIENYRLFAKQADHPVHVGVTEAGLPGYGTIKSAIGIGTLLREGIGDTIRVSLTGDRRLEVEAAFDILKATGRRLRGPEIVSCPSCGRVAIDLERIVKEVQERIRDVKSPIRVAILGCAVNGPGEASEADVGLAGGTGTGLLFRKGRVVGRVEESGMVAAVEREVRALEEEMRGTGS